MQCMKQIINDHAAKYRKRSQQCRITYQHLNSFLLFNSSIFLTLTVHDAHKPWQYYMGQFTTVAGITKHDFHQDAKMSPEIPGAALVPVGFVLLSDCPSSLYRTSLAHNPLAHDPLSDDPPSHYAVVYNSLAHNSPDPQ